MNPKAHLRETFSQPLDEHVASFISCVEDDARLLQQDLRGSLAHARMLRKQGILNPESASRIEKALTDLLAEATAGKLRLDPAREDVHMNVEGWLEERIGEDGGRLHAGRSRNDQVALDIRLFTSDLCSLVRRDLAELRRALLKKALDTLDIIVPGYTHLQRAQPVLLSHVLHSFEQALGRDSMRVTAVRDHARTSPLGAAALAGTSLPIDPSYTASELGLPSTFRNSLDAVSDRDHVVEFLFCCSLLAVHLSQIAETLLLWSTREFGFLSLPDRLTTGSSIMPQKRNADALELVRARAGIPIGELVRTLIVLKALPAGYNRDLQETKPPLAAAAESLIGSIRVLSDAVREMVPKADRMLAAAADEDLMATDLAETLVLRGVPFREAHGAVARLVRTAREQGKRLTELTAEEWTRAHVSFEPGDRALLDPKRSVRSKRSPGGTSPGRVKRALQASLRELEKEFRGAE